MATKVFDMRETRASFGRFATNDKELAIPADWDFVKDRRCQTPHFDEETLKQLFLSAFNKLIFERDEICANFELIKPGFPHRYHYERGLAPNAE